MNCIVRNVSDKFISNMKNIPQDIIDKLCALSCESVAESLGIHVSKHKALCFVHDDHHPSLGFYGENRSRWHCFVCGASGNAISLVEQYSNLSFGDSCQWLCQQYSIPFEWQKAKKVIPKPIFRKRSKAEMPKRPFDDEVAQWLIDHLPLGEMGRHFLFDQRHLSPDVVTAQQIRSVEDREKALTDMLKAFGEKRLVEGGFVTITSNHPYLRFFTPCLMIPYLDKKKKIVGLQTRYLGDNQDAPRFQFLSKEKTRLYNMSILDDINPSDEVYISEGITDCLALLSAGKKAVAIPSATNLPRLDLMDLCTWDISMYPDNDDAGRKAFISLRTFFINQYTILTRKPLPASCKDYSDYYVSLYEQGK